MNQFQHNVIGLVLYGIIWNLLIKGYFYDEAEHQWWLELWRRIF